MKTKWFTISGIPLIAIASYRFKYPGISGKRVIDRVSLDWAQVFRTWTKTAIILLGAVLLILGVSWFFDHARH